MPTAYASLPTGQIYDARVKKNADGSLTRHKYEAYASRFADTRVYKHRDERVYETTVLTYGVGSMAAVTLAITVILWAVSAAVTAVAGGLVFFNADDNANKDVVKRWSAVLMVGAPVLAIGSGLWYGIMAKALAYSPINALIGGLALILFGYNALLLQWAEGHAMNPLHTRYDGADGVLEAAFVLQAFQLALALFNMIAGLYADLDWRPMPHEMEEMLRNREELEAKVDALKQPPPF